MTVEQAEELLSELEAAGEQFRSRLAELLRPYVTRLDRPARLLLECHLGLNGPAISPDQVARALRVPRGLYSLLVYEALTELFELVENDDE